MHVVYHGPCRKSNNAAKTLVQCAYCGGPIGQINGPPDGWQLEDGLTVCHKCCVEDTKRELSK